MKLKETEDFVVECLGEVDEYVYDIEVEDNHNFFGNGILVHNSAYISIAPFINSLNVNSTQEKVDYADRFCEEAITPKIQTLCGTLCDYVNGYEQRMNWSREAIAESAIWVRKKSYAMDIWDDEGVRFRESPKTKVTGLESVRSSTPEWARNYLEECYKIGLNGSEQELQKRVEEIYQEFLKLDVNSIAKPTGVNNVEAYAGPNGTFKSKTPAHVKAAIAHNHLIDVYELNHIPKITSGDKIKTIKLKMPYPSGYESIGFDTYLPKEFELEEYVDYDSVYEDAFLSNLRFFLKSIGWNEEEVVSLEDFM